LDRHSSPFTRRSSCENPTWGEPVRACSEEGASHGASLRSFVLESRRAVAIEMPRYSVRFRPRGELAVKAFNLGADGMHLMFSVRHKELLPNN